jgi:hypothetical protein
MSQVDDLPYGMPYQRETRYDPPTGLTVLHEQPLRPMKCNPDGVECRLVTGHAQGRGILADPRFVTGERFTRANRDFERYERPHELDVDRETQGHMAFGRGVHQCVGRQLARAEMRIGFAKLIEAFPDLRLAVPSEEIPMRSDMAEYGVRTLPVAR